MGHLKELNGGDTQEFPGAEYAVAGAVPVAQCEEPLIILSMATYTSGQSIVTKSGAFTGIDLAGKVVEIGLPFGEAGTYAILSNTDDTITIDHTFSASGSDLFGNCKDSGQAYLTRDKESFIRFIQEEGYSYTIKGGQLFTDCPNPPMADACSTVFAPLT